MDLSVNLQIVKSLKVSLSHSFYDGGLFLGSIREDTSNQISLSYPVYKGINITLGYTSNVSTIKSFNNNGPLISFSLPVYKL